MSRSASFIAVAVAVATSFDAIAGCTPYWLGYWQGGQQQINLTASDYAVADFNDDGRADLASITDTTVSVTLTTANGTHGTTATLATGTGKFESITATDVTGDEIADIIVNDTTTKSLIVIPSHGDGTFGAAVTTTTPLAPTELIAGDFTGDGKTDIAWAHYSSKTLAVWSGNNLGAFTEVSSVVLTGSPTTFVAADFDSDTKLDLFVAVNALVPGLALYRGNGNGTFVTPAELSVSYYLADSLAAADLDDDGDADLLSRQTGGSSVQVYQNTGGTLVQLASLITALSPYTSGKVLRFAIADVTRDATPDVVVAAGPGSESNGAIVTFAGNGDGTFAAGSFTLPTSSPTFVTAGDATGDLANDLFVASSTQSTAVILTNHCGAVFTSARAAAPLISSGSSATITATVAAMKPFPMSPDAPAPTGTITAKIGSTTYGSSAQMQNAQFTIAGLSVGTHEVVLQYSGDDRYRATTFAPVTVRVTNATTTVTLTPDKTELPAGHLVVFTFGATASDGDTPSGSFTFSRTTPRNEETTYTIDGASTYSRETTPGTYSYRVRFNGSETHPPSGWSAPVSVTFTRHPSTLIVHQAPSGAMSEPQTIAYRVSSLEHTGTISFYVDSGLVSTKTITPGTPTEFSFTASQGRHRLSARYSGNDDYLPAEHELDHVMFPSGQLVLDVSQIGTTVQIRWRTTLAIAGATIKLYRAVNNIWQLEQTVAPYTGAPPVANPVQNTVYIYRAEAWSSGTLVATSNIDAALFTTFTNDPLVAGAPIKAVHVTELVTAINRYLTALGAATMAPIANAAAGKQIRAADFSALRSGITDARLAAGMGAPQYGIITAKQTVIRAVDLQQLRDAIR